MGDIFNEAIESDSFQLDSLTSVETKKIYEYLTETMPPPKVVYKYPEKDHNLVWQRLNSGVQ